MRLIAPILLLAVLLAVMVFVDRPRPRAEFVHINATDAFTLDPQRMSYQQDIRMARALFENLVVIDDNGKPIPGLASSWEKTPDLRTWTFHLRPGAKWSNGDPVTSHDFAYAWRRLILPDSAADYTGFGLVIDGAQEFFEWRTEALKQYAARPAEERNAEAAAALWAATEQRFRETVGVSTPDDHTIVVKLARPVLYWLDLVAFPALAPVNPRNVEPFVSIDPATARLQQKPGWTKGGVLISNGPYRLDEWRYKRNMRFERNPYFRDPSLAIVDSIDAIPIENPSTAVMAFESGEIDWISDLLAEYRADMLEARMPTVHGLPSFGTDFFSFNCRPTLATGEPNPFADPRVRRAFALATDRQVLVDFVTRLHEPVSPQLVPPGTIAGYHSPKGLPFDPVRARQELAAAGWSDRDGDGFVEDAQGRLFPVVDVMYTTASPRYRDLALELCDMWRKNLGIRSAARGKDTKFYKDDLKNGNFMVARGGWYGDYGDPTTFLELSRTGDGNNDRGYSNPRFDAMLDEAARETDPAHRMEILSNAERFLVEEELPILPICSFLTIYMYDADRVSGLTHHPRLDQYLGRVRVTPKGSKRSRRRECPSRPRPAAGRRGSPMACVNPRR